MKFREYNLPDDLLYTKEHEWARMTGRRVKVGITDYAAKTLNDVVYVSLPKGGQKLRQMEVLGTVESIKAVSELYSPLSGLVSGVNDDLAMRTDIDNQSTHEQSCFM